MPDLRLLLLHCLHQQRCQLSTSASEDTSSLSIAISGNYGTADGRAALKQQLQQAFLKRQTHVTVLRAGGTGNLPAYSADDLIAASLTFPDTVQQHPFPMQAQLASYNTIAPPLALTANQEAFIQPLFRAYQRAIQYSGDLAYLKSHTSEFRTLTLPESLKAEVAEKATTVGEPPKSGDLKAWQAFEAAKAAHELNSASEFASLVKQKVVLTDFNFSDIDTNEVQDTADRFDDYVDKLGSLTKQCLNVPKTGCSGKVPPPPSRIPNLVRTFVEQRDWNTAAGPMSIVLDSSWICKVPVITGTWRIADAANAPVANCDTSLPHTVTNGYVVTGGFDSYYADNHGTCTYQFLCFRR